MAVDYTNIDEVVNDFQLMIDDTSYDKEAQIYQLRLLALQGLRELTFDVEQVIKTTVKSINNSIAFPLPDDYVKLLRVGYKNDDGDFVSLGYSSNVSLDASIESQVGTSSYDENNPYYHTDIGKKFGVGGGKNSLGYYRLNRNDNSISFSSDVEGKDVFIEYISDGISKPQYRDHVIKLKFNSAVADSGGVIDGSVLRIPLSSSNTQAYTFITGNTKTNTNIIFTVGDSSGEIAKKFADVINHGYPENNTSPLNSDLKASQVGNEVHLVYSNLTSNLVNINHTVFEENHDGSQMVGYEAGVTAGVSSRPLDSAIELVQRVNVSEVPRVHKFCEEALRCYMYYKYIQRKRGIPANEKQMAKRSYYNEKRLARARMMNFNKEAAMQVSRKAFKQSPKI
tara:strand:- start:14826 stop:16013 length:1188 start_codon:yes stop_codon:yes gene_type:complete